MADACATGDIAIADEAEAIMSGDGGAVTAEVAADGWLCSLAAVKLRSPSRCVVERLREVPYRVLSSLEAVDVQEERPGIATGPVLLPWRLWAD